MPRGIWKYRDRPTGPDTSNYIHGHASLKGTEKETPTYRSWQSMLSRCYNEKAIKYPKYGAVGISVCLQWHTFVGFLEDMGEPPPGTSIERKDNSRGYEPGNCRWATSADQARNRRTTKLSLEKAADIRRRRSDGEQIKAIARMLGVSQTAVSNVLSGRTWNDIPSARPTEARAA